MARLFIIDQSLCSPGGHHFDYVNCVARAAREDQLETFVATNRRFNVERVGSRAECERPPIGSQQDDALHENAIVVPSFKNTTYQKVSWLAGLRHLKRANATAADSANDCKDRQSVLRRLLGKRRTQTFKQHRRKIIAQFAADCSRFFRCALDGGEFQNGDNVFLTTVSELELMGLAIYLFNNPTTQNATWHLQFHFNLFDGRTPEFDSQSGIQRKVRGCFLAALSRVPDHDLKFFCTSEELVEQYSRLTVVDFFRLPYPVNQRFAPQRKAGRVSNLSTVSVLPLSRELSDSGDTAFESENESSIIEAPKLAQPSGPVRLVVPGELRREKGSANHLQSVVDELWEDYLSNGRLQIAVQRPKRKLFRKEKLELQLPDSKNSVGGDPVIDYMRHPLSESDYCDFIRGADFGLLLHDSRAYYSRRAGVLGELLSCGKPVIVPAGCWLAHQLQESQFQHIDSMTKQLPHSRTVGLRELNFDTANAPLSGGVVSFDRLRHPFVAKCSRAASENIVVVSFDWQHPKTRGVDVRIKCTESRSDGSHESSAQVVGHRITAGKCHAMFRVDFGGNDVCFEIENAFDDSTASIRNLSIDFFEASEPENVPLGSFGLIYPDVASISASVAEMVEHLDHFRYQAEQFSHRWWNSHDPRRTLKYLVGENEAGLKVA